MIPPAAAASQPPARERVAAGAVTSQEALRSRLGLAPEASPVPTPAGFGLRVPRHFVDRMAVGDADDPLLRQVLPTAAELAEVDGFTADPVGDRASRRAPGVLQKYAGRALLVATGACAVHCRYCFRREFDYASDTASRAGWSEALDHIAADRDIHEVILSGGDPLTLATRRLRELTQGLADIPHVRRLRIHSRVPVVDPARVDAALVDWLETLPLQRVLVIHCNHARELCSTVSAALARVRSTGTTLLNQAVLLRGVNDSVQALCDLGESLFAAGVLPYYLHQLDRVRGAAHFEVPDQEALALHAGMAARLPGYLVPRLVREVPGAPGKSPVSPGPARRSDFR